MEKTTEDEIGRFQGFQKNEGPWWEPLQQNEGNIGIMEKKMVTTTL